MNIEFLSEEDLETMEVEELEALNQEMGRKIDSIREYRRKINAAHDFKIIEARKASPGGETTVPVESLVGRIK